MKDLEKNEVLLSIICNTYNHENYISDAIDSFLKQKVNFKYEILIHDDASKDNTALIIKEYEMKYPDIVKPIYQEENQYSKGVKIGQINRKRSIGKYYAICEGDDYWSDPNKLQKQVDYLEKNSDCIVCVHAAIVVDAQNKNKISEIRPGKRNREFDIKEVIEGGGSFIPTNSMVYRKNMGNLRPDFYYKNKCSFGDYQLIILLALLGKIYYLDEFMSVYRHNVPGSWSERNLTEIETASKHWDEVNSMLEDVNAYTKYAYDDVIQKTKENNEFKLLLRQCKLKEIKSEKFNERYNELNQNRKIALHLRYYFPNLYTKLYLLKRKFFNEKPKY